MAEARPRILCVDDEQHVLDGLVAGLRRLFRVETAPSGAEGLEALSAAGPFAVVVSDMRMPGMDGAAFLARVREHAPDTVRILLTGQTDVDTAIAAVNEGEIFRFLSKPCAVDTLRKVLGQGVRQHRLLSDQRILLEETLRGSVKALTEALALSNPIAFGRARQIKELAGRLAQHLELSNRWEIEVAAMLSQAACIALPPSVAAKLHSGRSLSASERAMVDRLPEAAEHLIASIPRLEGVRGIIASLGAVLPKLPAGVDPEQVFRGAQVLRVVLEHDALVRQGSRADEALAALRERQFPEELIEGLVSLTSEPHTPADVRDVGLDDLVIGMTLAADVQTKAGALLVPAGHEVTSVMLERLRNFDTNVAEPVRVTSSREWTTAEAVP